MISGQYFAKYTGIVEDNSDADKLGQIQVSVPSIFPPDEKVQARAALPYGYFFVPEKQAKVWVEFEGGDPGLPLWTGIQMMQSADWASEAAVDPPQKRVIKTAAGHVVVFTDKSGDEAIEIKDGVNGHDMLLDKNGIDIKEGVTGHDVKLDKSGILIQDAKNSHKITMSSSGVTIEVASGAKVELASSGITIDAGGGILQLAGSLIKLGQSAAMPVLRIGDSGVGNLGAPVPLIGPGAPTVLA